MTEILPSLAILQKADLPLTSQLKYITKTNKKSNIFKIKLENTRQNKKPLPKRKGPRNALGKGS